MSMRGSIRRRRGMTEEMRIKIEKERAKAREEVRLARSGIEHLRSLPDEDIAAIEETTGKTIDQIVAGVTELKEAKKDDNVVDAKAIEVLSE